MGRTFKHARTSAFRRVSERDAYEAELFFEELTGRSAGRSLVEALPPSSPHAWHSDSSYSRYDDNLFDSDEREFDDDGLFPYSPTEHMDYLDEESLYDDLENQLYAKDTFCLDRRGQVELADWSTVQEARNRSYPRGVIKLPKKNYSGYQDHHSVKVTLPEKTYHLNGNKLQEDFLSGVIINENKKKQTVNVTGMVRGVGQKSRLHRGRRPSSITYRINLTPSFAPTDSVLISGDLLKDAKPGTLIYWPSSGWIRTRYEWEYIGRMHIPKRLRKQGKDGRYQKYGGKRVEKVLKRLNDPKSVAPKLSLSPKQITIIQAVAAAETGGKTGCVNTWDNMYVSVGFKQVTLGCKTLQPIIKTASKAFEKYDIKLEKATYTKRRYCGKKPTVIPRISGTTSPNELRKPKWALRFYAASMEDDVVIALAKAAVKGISKVESEISQALKSGKQPSHRFFNDVVVKSLLVVLHNNRPAYLKKVIHKMKQSATYNRPLHRIAFINLLLYAIKPLYKEEAERNKAEWIKKIPYGYFRRVLTDFGLYKTFVYYRNTGKLKYYRNRG